MKDVSAMENEELIRQLEACAWVDGNHDEMHDNPDGPKLRAELLRRLNVSIPLGPRPVCPKCSAVMSGAVEPIGEDCESVTHYEATCTGEEQHALALIYLTQCLIVSKNISSRDRAFAIFLLLCVRLSVTSESGRVRWIRPFAALTTNHLLWKGDLWLTPILSACRNHSSTICFPALTLHSLASIATWPHWSKPGFSTRSLRSFLTANPNRFGPMRIFICSEPCGVSKNETGKDSHKLATEKYNNELQPPAPKGRVFASGLASRSSPEEYGGEQIARCGGAL